MATILALPDELIEVVGTHVMSWRYGDDPRHVGIKAWCRITSTCRRLWKLQLPNLHRDLTSRMSVKFVEGPLHRSQYQVATCLLQPHLGTNLTPCFGQVRHGRCGACKQHPGLVSMWLPSEKQASMACGITTLQSLVHDLLIACKSMWRQLWQHPRSFDI